MNFTFSSIMSAFVFGVIGLYLFKAARRNSNFYWYLIAVALMVYPMFSPNAWVDWGGGLLLCGLAYLFKDY